MNFAWNILNSSQKNLFPVKQALPSNHLSPIKPLNMKSLNPANIKNSVKLAFCLVFLSLQLSNLANAQLKTLKANFVNPKDAYKPGVYWYFMDGNMSAETITKDLESMKKAGIGNLIFLEVNVGIPRGPVDFLSAKWTSLFLFAEKEAKRLGIEITEEAIKYYSGTAVYHKTFDLSPEDLADNKTPLYLDLGKVSNLARVTLNGKDLGVVWTAPWKVDISSALMQKNNQLKIEVVNLWPNRLIGDEKKPYDGIRGEKWPDWLINNQPRKSGRFTFTSTRQYSAGSPLMESGLLGPVRLVKEVKVSLKN